MKKNLITIITLLIGLNSHAQEKKFAFRVYISPSICKSSIQNRNFKDGSVTLTNLTKSQGLFFGGGLETLKKLNKNWLIG